MPTTTRPMHSRFVLPLLCATVFLASACSSVQSKRSPDILYSDTSSEARPLQVPPDLTDVTDAEQFILPGNSGGAITRNTLLPSVDDVTFERGDAGSWLELRSPPEDLWPLVIEFVQANGYSVAETLPAAGTLSTRWSEIGNSGVLSNLLGNDVRERLSFRLERDGRSSRLFARRQVADADAVEDATAWPAASSDPEATSEVLARLLVFLGLSEQESEGVITSAEAEDVLNPANIRTTSAGSQMVVHRGYLTAFDDLADALERSGNMIDSRNDALGRIAFSASEEADAAPRTEDKLVLQVVPVHISAVRVAVTDDDGRRLSSEDERALFASLLDSFV